MKNKFKRDLDEEIPEEIWYHMWITHQQHNHWNWGNLVGRTRLLTLMLQITSKQTNTKQPCWKLWKCGHVEPNHTHIWENKTGIHSALGKLGERLWNIWFQDHFRSYTRVVLRDVYPKDISDTSKENYHQTLTKDWNTKLQNEVFAVEEILLMWKLRQEKKKEYFLQDWDKGLSYKVKKGLKIKDFE